MYQQQPERPKPQVIVSDINMPFWSMVWFMVKWAFASIPALLLVIFICFAVGLALFTGIAGVGLTGAAIGSSFGASPTPTPVARPLR